MMKHVTGARCLRCGSVVSATPNLTTCPRCGGLMDIEYDYDAIAWEVNRDTMAARREQSMWRYLEYLPVEGLGRRPRLRVGWSPFYEADALARKLGLGRLCIKDDGVNPTASLKDRASAMAVVKAEEAGAEVIACSSTGNAASSLAGNAAAAGFPT